MNPKAKKVGNLERLSLEESLALVSKPTLTLIQELGLTKEVQVTKIDPSFSDTASFCDHYQVSPDVTVNCVVLEARREGRTWYCACVVLATTKADVNSLAKRHLDASRISFAPMEKAVELTKMEYGAITPVGLPADWPILVDSKVVEKDQVIIGSGVRGSKLILPGNLLAQLPNAVVLEGLGLSRE